MRSKSTRPIVAKNVTENLFERHMKPLLLGQTEAPQPVCSPKREMVPA
jgi:hypothetical protein